MVVCRDSGRLKKKKWNKIIKIKIKKKQRLGQSDQGGRWRVGQQGRSQ